MTDRTNPFSHPATKVARCMAVPGSLSGVNPSHVGAWCDRDELPTYACSCHVAVLAVSQFRKEFPELASRFDALRAEAALRGPACGDTASAAGAKFSAYPDGNNGDNLTNLTDKAVS